MICQDTGSVIMRRAIAAGLSSMAAVVGFGALSAPTASAKCAYEESAAAFGRAAAFYLKAADAGDPMTAAAYVGVGHGTAEWAYANCP